MPNTYATYVAPVPRRFIGLAKEAAAGTAVMPTYTFPMMTFNPVDKITYLEDSAWRSAMAGLYNMIRGVRISDVSVGGPLFADGIGYALANILGDYSVSISNGGTALAVAGGGASAGATTLSVASGTLTLNTPVLVYNSGSSGFAEVVTPTAGTGTGPYTLSRGLYYAHAAAAGVVPATASTLYTHTFSLLNSGSGAGGYNQAQPPAYTWTDYTGLGGTNSADDSIGAREYAYGCLSEVTIVGTATGLVEWSGKLTALASVIAPSTPSPATTAVIPEASWLSTVALGGTVGGAAQVYNNSEWKLTLTRKLAPFYTNSGQSDPFAIVRGAFTAELGANFDPAQNESTFLYYLNNTQPPVQIQAVNGLSGGSATTLTVNAQQAAFNTGQITDSKEAFGYEQNAMLVANTANAGVSGAYSPLSISLTNAVPSY